MDTYGTVTAPDTIRFERLLPGPIERVWAYLTEPEKRAKWLAGGPMELRIGGEVKLWFHHASLDAVPDEAPAKYKQYENGSSMLGRITRCEPPHVLGYSWSESTPDRISEVTFELSPRGGEVLLVLTHKRLPDHKELLGVAGGWHTHLDILDQHLHGRTSPGFWGAHARVDEQYERRLADL
jgi:uncharacterized protein YndB with AHSA1/START domain